MKTSTRAPADVRTVRTDQVGSLLRPEELKRAAEQTEARVITADEQRQVEDEAIRRVVAEQERIGVRVVTDGEFRRLNFQDSFGASVAGFASTRTGPSFHAALVAGGAPGQRWDPGYNTPGPAISRRLPAVEPLRLVRNRPLEEFRFTSILTQLPVKVTLIGPDRITQRFAWEDATSAYPDVQSFVDDVVKIQHQMVAELADAGCRYVHIDEPGYTAYVDQPLLAEMRARGEDPAANLTRSIAADNAVIAGLAARGVTTGVHLCRGNQAGMWHREGTYDAIAEQLFGELAFDRLLLEYDTDRAGGFEPLRFVPQGKIVVLGLVTTKSGAMERADDLIRRIEEAARYLPIEQLAISPQCGFSSDLYGNPITVDEQWQKLELIERVAEHVWG